MSTGIVHIIVDPFTHLPPPCPHTHLYRVTKVMFQLRWCSSVIIVVVLQWCHSGVAVVLLTVVNELRWPRDAMALHECYDSMTVVLVTCFLSSFLHHTSGRQAHEN
jgi:hypothetical protein